MNDPFVHGGMPHKTVENAMAELIDAASESVTYICYASAGTPTSEPAWSCSKITVTGSVKRVTWADSGRFTQVADDRATLIYT